MSARLRLLGALLAALAVVPLIGAVNTTLTKPIVIVYPLTVGSGMEAEAGASVAVLLAQKLAQYNDVVVKPYPPGTKRQDFLTAAAAAGADYYVTGFLTPLGDEASLVVQIVSVASGTVVLSNTALVKTYGDAGAQSEFLHNAILHHAGRALASLDKPPTSDTPAPNPSAKDEANVSNVLGLFKHKKKAEATPTPESGDVTPPAQTAQILPVPTPRVTRTPRATPTPRPTHAPAVERVAQAAPPTARPTPRPTPTLPPAAAQVAAVAGTPLPLGNPVPHLMTGASALVLVVTGGDDAHLDAYEQDAFVAALERGGVPAESLPANPAELPKRAGEYCAAAFGAKTLYVPKLTVDRNADGSPSNVTLDVTSYDCSGNPISHQQSHVRTGRNVNAALDYVASATVSGFTFPTR